MGDLVFSGISFNEYGVDVDGSGSWVKPERDTTAIHVPGRSGDLIIDNGCWKNIDITYNCSIKSGWREKFPAFIDMLYRLQGGYEKLTYFDMYGEPQGTRMAEFKGGISPALEFALDTGSFELTFNCKPFMEVLGQNRVADFRTEDVELRFDNPYGMLAYPEISLSNANDGAFILFNNVWTLELAENSFARIVIDCELETCTGYDSMGENPTNASNLLTITRLETPGIDRDYPYFETELGMPVIFCHEITDGEIPPTVLKTYTGIAEVYPKFTRI